MSRVKKSILLAFIAPVIMAGCQSTSYDPAVLESNRSVKTKLTPLNEFFTGHALLGCENRLNIDNYDSVMKERVSGVYGNPLSNSCIPISFEEFEPEDFYEDIISKARDPENAKQVIAALKRNGYSEGKDGMHILKVNLDDGRVAQIMRFNDGETFSKLKSMWRERDEMLAFIDEFVFLHELFHLSAMNFDKSLPKNVREGISDVSTVLALSTKHNLTLNQTIDLAEDVQRGRIVEASDNPYGRAFEGTHYNKRILSNMIGYLARLQDNGGELKRIKSLKEINEYAMDMVLDLDHIERENFDIGNVYWERGMEVPEEGSAIVAKTERRPFEDVLSIARNTIASENSGNNNLTKNVAKKGDVKTENSYEGFDR